MKISVLLIVCYVFVCCVTYKVFENQSPMTTIKIPMMMLPKEYMSGCSSDPDLNKCTLSRAKEENVVNPPVKPTIKKKCASSFNTFSLFMFLTYICYYITFIHYVNIYSLLHLVYSLF